jgi:hypothetical protein
MRRLSANRFTTIAAILGLSGLMGCGGGDDTATDTTTTTPPVTTPDGGATDGTADGGEAVDPHDVPLTEEEIATLKEDTAEYQAAVDHIKQYRDTIRDETTGGEPAKAHRALDNADWVLQWLPEVAQNSNVPKEQWETVGENAQKIRDLFNQVHANIDEGKDADYGAVAADVDAAVAALEGVTTAAADGAATDQ